MMRNARQQIDCCLDTVREAMKSAPSEQLLSLSQLASLVEQQGHVLKARMQQPIFAAADLCFKKCAAMSLRKSKLRDRVREGRNYWQVLRARIHNLESASERFWASGLSVSGVTLEQCKRQSNVAGEVHEYALESLQRCVSGLLPFVAYGSVSRHQDHADIVSSGQDQGADQQLLWAELRELAVATLESCFTPSAHTLS